MLNILLDTYRSLLLEVDGWFSGCLQAGQSSLACRVGCSACCRGLFDITLLEAWLLKRDFAALAEDVRGLVLERCRSRLAELQERWPELGPPYLLNALPEEEWTGGAEDDQTPCPLLDGNGLCLVYAARPMTCRLHGLPNIDISGQDFEGTVCTLHPVGPSGLPESVLHWRFRELFAREVSLIRGFNQLLTGRSWKAWDTYIPLALLADYQNVDWGELKP